MKTTINYLVIIFFTLICSTSLATAQNQKQILTDEEKNMYVGEYEFKENNEIIKRSIVLKDDILYYVVNKKTEIPLKPESKTKFNLYPSATYLYFEFNQNKEVEKLTIKTGSGRIMEGYRVKNKEGL